MSSVVGGAGPHGGGGVNEKPLSLRLLHEISLATLLVSSSSR